MSLAKRYINLIIGLTLTLYIKAFTPSGSNNWINVSDGPYIFRQDGNLKALCIRRNSLKEWNLTDENFYISKDDFHLIFDFNDLNDTDIQSHDFRQEYKDVDSIVIISDVHGDFKTYIRMLKATGVIDKELNWQFGKGHLVVLGDIFDRGDKVTETLWHLFGLEKQASRAGGMLHLLLGNHELMMFSGDLTHINNKYLKTADICNMDYSGLYSDYSVLGKWLRTKPVIISINDILMVHAGISEEMIRKELQIDQINSLMADLLSGRVEDKNENNLISFLGEEDGPLWYRGYFMDPTFCESRIDSILAFYNKEYIVVGHTSHKGIIPLYNNKIFGTDTGISQRHSGELLIYKDGVFYKGNMRGRRTRF